MENYFSIVETIVYYFFYLVSHQFLITIKICMFVKIYYFKVTNTFWLQTFSTSKSKLKATYIFKLIKDVQAEYQLLVLHSNASIFSLRFSRLVCKLRKEKFSGLDNLICQFQTVTSLKLCYIFMVCG